MHLFSISLDVGNPPAGVACPCSTCVRSEAAYKFIRVDSEDVQHRWSLLHLYLTFSLAVAQQRPDPHICRSYFSTFCWLVAYKSSQKSEITLTVCSGIWLLRLQINDGLHTAQLHTHKRTNSLSHRLTESQIRSQHFKQWTMKSTDKERGEHKERRRRTLLLERPSQAFIVQFTSDTTPLSSSRVSSVQRNEIRGHILMFLLNQLVLIRAAVARASRAQTSRHTVINNVRLKPLMFAGFMSSNEYLLQMEMSWEVKMTIKLLSG